MKKLFVLSIVMVISSNSFAYYGKSSEIEIPEWLTFIGIIMIVWGILEIILFFKIWSMTDHIKALKKDHFNETALSKDEMVNYLRKNLILGDIEKVKRTLLLNFFDNVEENYKKMSTEGYEKNEKGESVWVSFLEKNLNESIRPYVENLQKQYDKIGEKIPVYIQRMKTYGDYFNLFAKDDLTIEIERETEKNN